MALNLRGVGVALVTPFTDGGQVDYPALTSLIEHITNGGVDYMIVLGTSVGLSISRMFMSGIVPGLIIGIALMVVWYFVVRIDDYHDVVHFTREEGLKMVISSLPALFMPILIVGGIRLGIFTPTEAGAFIAELCLRMLREKASGLDLKV